MHPTIREHLSQDGEVPLLLSHHLRSTSRRYIDVAELELVSASDGPLAEADLIALSDRQLITAEAKRHGSLGTATVLRRTVAKRALIAEQLRADQILIATADDEWDRPASTHSERRSTTGRGAITDGSGEMSSGAPAGRGLDALT